MFGKFAGINTKKRPHASLPILGASSLTHPTAPKASCNPASASAVSATSAGKQTKDGKEPGQHLSAAACLCVCAFVFDCSFVLGLTCWLDCVNFVGFACLSLCFLALSSWLSFDAFAIPDRVVRWADPHFADHSSNQV